MARKRNLKPVKGTRLFFGYLGLFMILIGLLILVPLALIPFFPSEGGEYHLFLGPSIVSIVIGIPLFALIVRRPKARMTQLQSLLLLLTLWIVSILISALPFMITGEFSFTQAVFEATSGLSTTAESLLKTPEGIEACSHIFLFYRIWLLFIGGIGLTLILTSALSDVNNLSIYHLEGHDDKLLPNLVKSSRMILLIYVGYIALGFGAYKLTGMPTFDAFCTSISALSTGGFSVAAGGLSSYANGVWVEIITEILMLLGATNFVIHFALIRGKFKTMFYHSEFFVFVILFICFVPIFVAAYVRYYLVWRPDPLQDIGLATGLSIRRGIFIFVSSITSTGFSIEDSAYMYQYMDPFLTTALLLCLVIGGQTGSTAGGIKQMRLVQAAKEIHWNVQDLIKGPHVVQPHTIVKYGKRVNVGPDEGKSATAFIFIYISIILFFSFIFTCTNSWFVFGDALYETINLISGAGFTSGKISMGASPAILWTGTATMLVGRLEPIVFIMVIAEGWGAMSKKLHERRIDKRQNAI